MRKECGNINVTEPNIICTCTLNFKRTSGRIFSLGMSTRYSDLQLRHEYPVLGQNTHPQSTGWRDSNALSLKELCCHCRLSDRHCRGCGPVVTAQNPNPYSFGSSWFLVASFLFTFFFFVQNPVEADGVGSIDAGRNRAMDMNELFHFLQVVGGRSDSLMPVSLSYAHHINTTAATVLSL